MRLRAYLPTNAGTPIRKSGKRPIYARQERVGVPTGEQAGIFPLAHKLTEKQIRKVRAHAVATKLHKLMFACDRALRGSFRARVTIARWYLTGVVASR